VLTAGHVSSQADRNVMVILQDGRTVRGKTLGANHGIDSGLIKISDKNPDGGDWPFADVARSKPIKPGEWCMATGHPGGYQRGRTPVAF
jgi:S1-C subfamily serine protease